jgi:hypothetical protein
VVGATGVSANVGVNQLIVNIDSVVLFNFGVDPFTLEKKNNAEAIPNTFEMHHTGSETRAQFLLLGQEITKNETFAIRDSIGKLNKGVSNGWFTPPDTLDPWWKILFNLELKSDSISIQNGFIHHVLNPHPQDGPAFEFEFGHLEISAIGKANNQVVVFNLPDLPGNDHGPHFDQVKKARLKGTANGANGFKNWSFEFRVEHVPEPGSFSIMVFLGLGGLATRTIRRRKMSTANPAS